MWRVIGRVVVFGLALVSVAAMATIPLTARGIVGISYRGPTFRAVAASGNGMAMAGWDWRTRPANEVELEWRVSTHDRDRGYSHALWTTLTACRFEPDGPRTRWGWEIGDGEFVIELWLLIVASGSLPTFFFIFGRRFRSPHPTGFPINAPPATDAPANELAKPTIAEIRTH